MHQGRGSGLTEVHDESLMDCQAEEEKLRDQLRFLNQRLLSLNSEAGQIEAERRTVQHRLMETSKALQFLQAGRVRRELAIASGSGPRTRRW